MTKVHWGIIGCADIVERRILHALTQEVNNGELYAIATRGKSARLERMLARFQPQKVYFSYEALLNDPVVDAVYLPLPNSMHAPWAIKALQAGKHVLCEKPIACTVAQLDEMAIAAKTSGKLLMEAFACMHSPLYPAIRNMIDDGEIGELRTVDSYFCFPITDMENTIIGSKEYGGGSIYDVGGYNMLTIRQLTRKEPQNIKAIAQFDLKTGVDTIVNAVLDMGDGVHAHYKSSIICASNRQTSLLGSAGYINFMYTPNTWGDLPVTLVNERGTQTVMLHSKNTYALEFEQMGRCILEGETPVMSLAESRKNVHAIEWLHKEIGSF